MKKIFIDCGANIGQSISLFARKWKDADEYEVHSFEPNPRLKESILNSASKNKLKNFHYHNEAIFNIDGETSFYVGGTTHDIGSSLEKGKSIKVRETIKVKTIDLSRWIVENFDKDDYIVLKIDIEGSEYKVMKCLFETKSIEYVNEIYLELHLENKVKIDIELRDDVNKLISECTTTKIYTDKHSKLNFT